MQRPRNLLELSGVNPTTDLEKSVLILIDSQNQMIFTESCRSTRYARRGKVPNDSWKWPGTRKSR